VSLPSSINILSWLLSVAKIHVIRFFAINAEIQLLHIVPKHPALQLPKMRFTGFLALALFTAFAVACETFNDCPGDQVCGRNCAFGPGEGAGSNICQEPCSLACKENCLCDGENLVHSSCSGFETANRFGYRWSDVLSDWILFSSCQRRARLSLTAI
jgi:hypothetical protein